MDGRTPPEKSPEYRAFQRHYHELVQGIQDPLGLAGRLFSMEIIDCSVVETMTTIGIQRQDKAASLLVAVGRQIRIAPNKLHLFLQAVKEDQCMDSLVQKVWDTCGMFTTSDNEPREQDSQTSNCQPRAPTFETPPAAKRQCIDHPSHSPLTSAPIAALVDPPSAMSHYAAYLKAFYTSDKLPTDTKWPPTPSEHYINLAYISKEHISRRQADEFTRATIQGNVDDILKVKGAMKFSEVAKLQGDSRPKIVLVEGAPGVGKTTFSWEFCRKWGSGEILKHYRVVLLLRLRDSRTRAAKSISDLIYHSDIDVKAVAQEICASLGRDTLILLEGLDELPNNLRTEPSLFLDIIHGRLLPHATIVITTRPWASQDIHVKCQKRISQHIEILGFTSEQIELYLDSVVGNQSELREGIKKYLTCYPQIQAAMYIPLNAAIVVEIYKRARKEECILPKTMTELYTALSQTLLLRYLYEHPLHSNKNWRISNFHDLPPDVYKQFCDLCKLAYEGLINDEQLIFSELSDDFETLGFMQSVSELYVNKGATVSHNFLHLTIQEYLAAVYLVQQSVEELMVYFMRFNWSKVVKRFVVGLITFSNIPFQYVKTLLLEGRFHTPEMDDCDIVIEAYGANLLFETQDSEIIDRIFKRSTVGFYFEDGLNIFDYYCLGYCIAHSSCQWKLQWFSDSTDEELMMLTTGMHTETRGTTTGTIKCIHLGYQDHEEFTTTPNVVKYFCTERFPVEELHILIDDKCCNSFAHSPSLSTIKVLELDSHVSMLFLALDQSRSSLPSLATVSSLSSMLMLNHRLTHLTIRGCRIDINRICQLAAVLSNNSSLLELSLSTTLIGTQGAVALADMLGENKTLQSLDLGRNGIETEGAVALGHNLRQNQSLQSLDLGNNNIGTQGAVALADMLGENKTLQSLDLGRNSIETEGAVALGHNLRQNKSLQSLNLSDNNIGTQGAVVLADMLCENMSLQSLSLRRNNSIGEEGTLKLLESLTANSTIQELNLPWHFRDYAKSCVVYNCKQVKDRVNYYSFITDIADVHKTSAS